MGVIDSIKTWARQLKRDVIALWFCQRHPDMPLAAKVLSIIVVAYAFSPIDLIPDFIPVLGFLDDAILLPIGIYFALRLIPAHVMADSRKKAQAWQTRRESRPKSYIAAAVFLLIWLSLGYGCWLLVRDYF